MKLLIDIPEDMYNDAMILIVKDLPELKKAIANGTPLPKKHGRLIDADEALKAMDTWDKFGYKETGHLVIDPKNEYVPYVHYEDMVTSIINTPTIIEKEMKNNG